MQQRERGTRQGSMQNRSKEQGKNVHPKGNMQNEGKYTRKLGRNQALNQAEKVARK